MDNIKIRLVKNKKELKEAQAIRYQVFTLEQGIDQNLDIDGEDESSDHIIAYLDNMPVGTLRIRYPKTNEAKLERMAVLVSARGQKIGKKLMGFALVYLKEKSLDKITLDAQYQAKGFYEKFGFQTIGEKFSEVGIDHIKMILSLHG